MSTQNHELSGRGKLNILGVLILLAGVGGALYFAFGFSTSENGEVINLDLQQDRLFGFLASLVAFLSGLLTVLFLNLSVAVHVSNPPPSADLSDELAKRAPVDEIRLHAIVQNAKKPSP